MLKNDLLILTAALIWGFAFVAQRAGMQFIGPFTYNFIRFAMGGLFLIPIIIKKKIVTQKNIRSNVKYGIILGFIIFLGSAFQQSGIVYTTAGNAGFITGLYVILVPVFGVFVGRRSGAGIWVGVLLAVLGLYFLTASVSIEVNFGNFLVFISAIFWAFHVLSVDKFTEKNEPLLLACIQFFVCSFLNIFGMLLFEHPTLDNIFLAVIPLIYGGFISTGIGFTLQVIAQKKAHPTHAAIILGLEAVFAVIGGIIILNEDLGLNTMIGCVLMLSGMMVSQLWQRRASRLINKNDR